MVRTLWRPRDRGQDTSRRTVYRLRSRSFHQDRPAVACRPWTPECPSGRCQRGSQDRGLAGLVVGAEERGLGQGLAGHDPGLAVSTGLPCQLLGEPSGGVAARLRSKTCLSGGGLCAWMEFSLEVSCLVKSSCRGGNNAGSRAWRGGPQMGFSGPSYPLPCYHRPLALCTSRVLRMHIWHFKEITVVRSGDSSPRSGFGVFCSIRG